jgi:hypothetical protein
MTLLRPLDDRAAHAPQQAPSDELRGPDSARAAHAPHAPHTPHTARSPRSRRLSAFVALVGLLIWASLTAPQLIAFTPQVASFSASTTRWLSDTLRSGGQPTGLALGSVNTPQACSSASASAVGSNLVVPADAWVCGDALAVGGNVDVEGHVQGSAQAIGGNVSISGEVDGDVTAVGGDITVHTGALTRGKLDSIGGRIIIEPGASAQTPVSNFTQSWYPGQTGPTTFHVQAPEASSFWLGLLFWVSAAIGLSAFLPEVVGHVRYTIARRFLISGFWGALVGVVGVVIGAALFVTCIGAPVALVIALTLWVAWVVGTVAFASWLGASLLRGTRRDHDPSLLLSTLLGVAILCLLKSAPVVGPVVSLIVGVVGLGAAALTLLSARRVSYAHLRW